MPLIEVEMLIGRNTTAGFKDIGEKIFLPQRESLRYISMGQAKFPKETNAVEEESETIDV